MSDNQIKVALYTRVSTAGQTTENQLMALQAVATQRGWSIVKVYEDHGVSGSKGRDKRPGLDSLLKDAVRGRFSVVMAWSVDRLGRSLPHLVTTLQEIERSGCTLYLHQQSLDTATPSGRALFGMLGVFAEFERAIIRERIYAGLARAKAKGVRVGRKPVKQALIVKVRDALKEGASDRAVADLTGVNRTTVGKVRRAMLTENSAAA